MQVFLLQLFMVSEQMLLYRYQYRFHSYVITNFSFKMTKTQGKKMF